MDEISRTEWFVIGVTGLALAGAAHAVAGAAHIARAAVSPSARTGGDTAGGAGLQVDSGPGGWIFLGALVLAAGAICHAAADAGSALKEVLNLTSGPAS